MLVRPKPVSVLGFLVLAASSSAALRGGDAPFPLQRGELVATFCPNGPDDDGFSVILVDPRSPPAGAAGSNWLAPFFSNASGPAADIWNYGNLGSVFGIAVDSTPDIFVSATSSYRDFSVFNTHTYGPGGGGAVYRLDGVTGAINTWVTLPNPAAPGVTPAGLGDICYDSVFDQFFVSDFADGRIYQVKKGSGSSAGTGVVVDVRDPFDAYPYPGNPTFAPVGERVWAVHVTNLYTPFRTNSSPSGKVRALLFSVWLRDNYHFSTDWPASWPPHFPFNPVGNAIFEWDLDSAGKLVSSGPTLWAVMPDLVDEDGNDWGYSQPVSDITSVGDFVVVAERSMESDYGSPGIAHEARVLVFSKKSKMVVLSSWPPTAPPPPPFTYMYRIGDYHSPRGWNSCGGVAVPTLLHLPNSRLWGTGDALLTLSSCNYVYGLQGIPLSGNQTLSPMSSTSLLIDLDHEICEGDKSRPGDVEYIPVNAE